MSVIIGIDLGTSTTEACIFRDGKPEMILNPEGQIITPSAVGLDEQGNWVAGARAKAQYLLRPENTAIEVKRKTGTEETVSLGKASYKPLELQSQLLSYIRASASEYLGENVDRAVISVPAYFNDLQRRETIAAGEMAGFSVERILNEPTAAALSYGLEHLDEESHVLVYDLGGGTFDVTLLEMFDGVLEVKASSGDNQLGGKDFDQALEDELFRRFRLKYGKDISTDRRAQARVKEEAEKCKIALSSQDGFRVLLPAIAAVSGQPVEMDEFVTLEQFENLTNDLLKRTHTPIDQVLEDTGLTDDEIDQIILVGGSTRMPMVSRDIADYLGKVPVLAVNPDFAVAEGAAIMSGMISGDMDEESSLVMTDVNPFSLGVRVSDRFDNDTMSVVIPRNTTIPVTKTERYTTCDDYQTVARIEVYQGESRIASHNHYLGEFAVLDIPPKPFGIEKIDIAFSYDLNGLLKVTATLVSTGKEASIEIQMGQDKKDKTDVSSWKDAKDAKVYRAIIRTAERMLSRNGLPAGMRERMESLLFALKKAIVSEQPEEAKKTESKLNALLAEARDET